MEMRIVRVKNMVNKTVGVKIPEYNVNKKWTRKGQEVPFEYGTLEQMLWHEGFRKMIDRGILYIENMQDKIDLGLEEDTSKEPKNIIVLNDGQIRTLLTIQTFKEFKDVIKTLTMTQIKNVVNYAIEHELVSNLEKCEYLQELTGTDIIRVVHDNRMLAKIDAQKGE